jgi:hypothetical protein
MSRRKVGTTMVIGAVLAVAVLSVAPASSGDSKSGSEVGVVAGLTRLSNLEIRDDSSFPYDTSITMNPEYVTWAGEGEPLVIRRDGWYWVWVNSTTLGEGYGGPPNADWLHAVGRNGIGLKDTIYSQRHTGRTNEAAQLMSGGSPVYLEVGDRLQVYYQNSLGDSPQRRKAL